MKERLNIPLSNRATLELPAHWLQKRLKYVASINDDVLSEETDPEYSLQYVDIGSVEANVGIVHREPLQFGGAPSRARRKVKHGDIIISTVRTYLRAVSPIVDPPDNLVVSTGFAVVRPKALTAGYAAHALQEDSFVQSIVAWSNGVGYPACAPSDLASLRVPVPPLAEQAAIAEFLDAKCASIDELVAKKRNLIEKLRQKRTALISRAVTRGLPPAAARAAGLPENPKLKDSGIPWLGDVPEHWDVRRSDSMVSTYKTQISPNHFHTKEVFHYSIPAVQESGTGVRESGADISSGKLLVTERLLLVSKLNPRKATVCIAEPQDVTTVCSTEFVPLVASRCEIRFLRYLALSDPFRQELESRVRSVTNSHQRAIPADVYRFWSAWPPLQEQVIVADYLDQHCAKIDALTAKIEEAITKIKEYRSAIISASVTGKIDVRALLDTTP